MDGQRPMKMDIFAYLHVKPLPLYEKGCFLDPTSENDIPVEFLDNNFDIDRPRVRQILIICAKKVCGSKWQLLLNVSLNSVNAQYHKNYKKKKKKKKKYRRRIFNEIWLNVADNQFYSRFLLFLRKLSNYLIFRENWRLVL